MLRRHLIGAAVASTALSTTSAWAQVPKGWIKGGNMHDNYEVGLEDHNGGKVAFIIAKLGAREGFCTLMQTSDASGYRGRRVKLSASMRTDYVGRAQMWLRVDGPNRTVLSFDNMDDRPVVDTTGWRRYEIVLDVPKESIALAYGFFLMGRGKVWADAFKIEVVANTVPTTGKPPPRPPRPSNLGFDESSLPATDDSAG